MKNNSSFEISLWKNNSKYEFRIPNKKRDLYFDKSVNFINLALPDISKSIKLKIRESFWNKCSHFGNTQVTNWLNEKHYTNYKKGNPTRFLLTKISNDSYQLSLVS